MKQAHTMRQVAYRYARAAKTLRKAANDIEALSGECDLADELEQKASDYEAESISIHDGIEGVDG